ncbi:sensor histidine kinase [Salipaludibacillus agaradhaerens]|uniref:sensor histidine kinase n=1 Tax=Salipaludibacillus agaradhaerens TaxID=76935 RepID=UPI002151B1F5|nr:sensor histidine kinase [Salipaludibacillus agaradhaerens]MCR6105484.1 sensor histidine kinase [Salipaludibacillus agaradhaerens]MCR6117522.1 sensor histidine kinase [Salipaludibacillus agaradhaerens]
MIKAIWRQFNHIKIRQKLIISFFVVVFVPLLIVGGMLTAELRKTALNNTIEQTTADMARIKTRVSEVITPAINVVNYALVDQRLKDLVTTEYTSIYEVVQAYSHYNTFDNSERLYTGISTIRFFVENETMLNNWQFIPLSEEMRRSAWYKAAHNSRGLLLWHYKEAAMEKGEGNQLTLTRIVHYPNDDTYGIIDVELNTNYLNWILAQEVVPLMIIDADHHVVAGNQQELIGTQLSETMIIPVLVEEKEGIFRETVFDEPSHVIVDPILLENSANDLRLVAVISDSDIVEDADRLSRTGFVIMLISMSVALVLIYGFAHLISTRIAELSKHIHQVTEGNLTVNHEIQGQDEIGELSHQFNLMTLSIQALLEEIEQHNNEKRELETKQSTMKFKMLASQIHPHFLFNTLETIRMEASIKGEKDLAHVVKKLGKLLRHSIDMTGELIPIKQEIEMVKAYLDIQKFRFKDRLTYNVTLDERVAMVEIPPLVIQPLVENAVIHGIQHRREGGQVFVNVHLFQEEINVEIRDNGPGMTDEQLRKISSFITKEEEEPGQRIGLKNVHERLRLVYKQSPGLQIDSLLDEGMSVSFSIPAITDSDR